jgi:hypothetical protein
MDSEIESGVSVEWIIVADAAEVVNGKLYLLGGGWDTFLVGRDFPVSRTCGLAVAFRVPWAATNQRFVAAIEITDADAKALATMNLDFEMGRPPGIEPGQAQRFQMAANLPLTFRQPGTYVVTVRVAETSRRTTIRVMKR